MFFVVIASKTTKTGGRTESKPAISITTPPARAPSYAEHPSARIIRLAEGRVPSNIVKQRK